MTPEQLALLRGAYPKRDGGQNWAKAARLIAKSLDAGAEFDQMLAGTRNYAIWCGRKGYTSTEYTMQAATFYGRDQHWAEWAEMDLRTPQQKAEEAQWQALEARAKALGFTEVKRDRGLSVAETALRLAESKTLRVVK